MEVNLECNNSFPPKILSKNFVFSFILYQKPSFFSFSFSLTCSLYLLYVFTMLDVTQYQERQISKETAHLDLSFELTSILLRHLKCKLLIFIFFNVKNLERSTELIIKRVVML